MTEDRKHNIKIRTCCICLNHTANSSDELMVDNDSPWLSTYMFCFGVTMSLDDGIPRQMCGNCRDKLQEYADFKKMALRSEKLWKCVINANNTTIKLKKSNDSQMSSDLEDIKSDEDNFNDNYETHVVSEDEYDGYVKNTHDVPIVDNTILNKEHNVTYEIVCFSCGCTFDTEKIYIDHLDNCVKIEKDLDTSKQASDSGPKSTSCLKPKSCKVKSRGTPKRKLKSHHKQTVKRKKAKKKTDADVYNQLEVYEHKLNALESNMESHLKQSDNQKKVLQKPNPPSHDCGLCEETFSNVAELQQHMTDHSNKKDLCCMICDFSGRDFADMLSHRMAHLPKEYKKEIRCHLCKEKFLSHMRLQFHYRSEHLKEKGGWCSKCNKRYVNVKCWVRHELIHKEMPYICDFCERRFLYRHEIVDHLRYHYKTYKFVCELCGRGFQKKYNLQFHIQSTHNDQKIKCTHCNKIYKNSLTLEAHMKEVTSEKPYQCEFCLKCYRKPYDLKRHKIWHLDDRKFVCKICGLAYKTNQYLKVHMSKHTGYKKHKCDQCTQCFPTTSQLKRHLSVHTGVRRHKCNHCTRSYNGRKYLLQHIAKFHNSLQSPPIDASDSIKT